MPKTTSSEEKKSTPVKSRASAKPEAEDATVELTAKKPTRATKVSEEEDDKPRHQSAASSTRTSIYQNILADAKKVEAERAAKAAARAQSQQQTPKPAAPPAGAQTAKKPASPFLTTNIGRAIPSTQKAAATPKAEPKPAPTAEVIKSETSPATGAPTVVAAPPTTPATAIAAPEAPIAPPQPQATSTATTVTTEPKREAAKAAPKPRTKEEQKPKAAEAAQGAPVRVAPAGPKEPKARPKPQPKAPPARPTAPQKQAAPAMKTVSVVSSKVTPKPASKPAVHPRPAQATPAKAPAKLVETVAPKPVAPPPPVVPTGPVAIPAVISVRELATLLNVSVAEMLKRLMSKGIFANLNQSLDYDTASLIAEEFGRETRPAEAVEQKAELRPSAKQLAVDEKDKEKGELRPPIVTVLGHVDHGKTSLLDAIRNTQVAAGEAGGITQHIGAYQIEKQGRKLTFLDTPGHEAFTAMRARGAQVTDVAVLVVAADDGVQPQTIEAINHARAANVPIVVALNKIDRETAEPQRVMAQLADVGVVVEQWGGAVPLVQVSAKKNIGIDELLDMILLVADLQENKANPQRPAIGTVIEAELDRNRGPVATLLVQNGTLRQNDYLVINNIQGRVRAMFDDRGQRVSEAGPSMPVQVLGLPSVPQAGDTFQVVSDERTARSMVEQAHETAQAQARAAHTLSLDDLFAQMEAGKVHDLNIVLKADVQGSLEPIRNSLEKLSTENLKVRILHQGLGDISENDVNLALASKAIVIGFNVEPDAAARRLAANEGVDIRVYRVIYTLLEDVEKALKGLLGPTYKEVVSGRAEVRQLFKVSKHNVAGCYVREGKAMRSGQARVLREGKVIWDGRVASLKRFTEDVREVLTGFECGVMLDGFEDVKPGDVIEFYHKEKEE